MLSDMFNSPDAYLNDWYGWATNQSGHVFIVGVGLYIVAASLLKLFFWWADHDEDHHEIGLWVTIIVYAGWEGLQFFAGSTVLDSIADWLFVACGAVLAFAIWKGRRLVSVASIITAFGALAVGVFRRRKK